MDAIGACLHCGVGRSMILIISRLHCTWSHVARLLLTTTTNIYRTSIGHVRSSQAVCLDSVHTRECTREIACTITCREILRIAGLAWLYCNSLFTVENPSAPAEDHHHHRREVVGFSMPRLNYIRNNTHGDRSIRQCSTVFVEQRAAGQFFARAFWPTTHKSSTHRRRSVNLYSDVPIRHVQRQLIDF